MVEQAPPRLGEHAPWRARGTAGQGGVTRPTRGPTRGESVMKQLLWMVLALAVGVNVASSL
ncbi:hypothetical protein, partial [Streptomyces sp. SID5785]|uniref:hypothetical protein n=1 Tax=Streptomyces sp. SID5785 TaxID=2690309 RepID=UPI001F365BCC